MGILRFRFLGFPIAVMPGYWLLSILIGLVMGNQSPLLTAVMMAVVFVSILVHELGHAYAAKAFGLPAQITLHMMGGATSFPKGAKLTRGRDVLISLAGPAMGLGLGVVAFGLLQVYASPEILQGEADNGVGPSNFVRALAALAWINLLWSVLNLVPVVPFDGGRILVAALGPERIRVAAIVSLVVGMGAAFLFLDMGWVFPAVLFGSASLSSFFRMRQIPNRTGGRADQSGPSSSGSRGPSSGSVAVDGLDAQSLERIVGSAERALEKNDYAQASMLAHSVLANTDNPQLAKRALHTFLWARLGAGDAAGARSLLVSAPAVQVDPYLVAATNEAAGHLDDAQRALSDARASGDERVEVTALLIKILLQQRKFSTAANLASEIVDESDPEDVRRVAKEASTGGAHAEAARLSLRLARSHESFADAEQALYGFAAVGAEGEALEAFKLAKNFDASAGRKLLDDERVRPVRSALEAAIG